MKEVTLALIQMSMSESKEENLAKAAKMIRQAAKKGAEIVCLPELFTTPYFPQYEDAKKDYAENIPGKTTDELAKLAKELKIIIVGGSIFEKSGNKYYNTTSIFDETGKMLGIYRKMHIPHDPNFYEQCYFEPGDLGFKVFETKNGKLGTLICYDQWYPEAARAIALLGADITFYPTAIGYVKGVKQTEGDWKKAWIDVQRGHAIANGMIVAPVNRVGTEGQMTFWGGSFVCDAFGKILAQGTDKEEVIIAKVDLDHSTFVREGWRFFYNRRPESYAELVRELPDVLGGFKGLKCPKCSKEEYLAVVRRSKEKYEEMEKIRIKNLNKNKEEVCADPAYFEDPKEICPKCHTKLVKNNAR